MSSILKNKKVLVVDDDQNLRNALCFDFKRKGCEVFEAENGHQAFEIIRSTAFDIVISDIRMPDGDGIELLKNIKTLNPETPVVLLATGYADISPEEAKALGACALIEKPLNRKLMFQILENSVSLHEH